MGTRNSCQLQKHYYDSMKKKELYYLKEKSSYLLVHLSEVFEKRLLHFLPYFGISLNIVYCDNITNPNIVRAEQKPTNQLYQACLNYYESPSTPMHWDHTFSPSP
jgi:hypothetical protein